MQTTNIDTKAITEKVWAIVNALPHREAILESDARFWVDEVVQKYGDLAIWHATRAGGFGGSQIGALVRNRLGERADHGQSARDIVAGSLLRKLPDDPNGPMRRGVAMEPQHRRWFQEKYAARRDADGFKTLSQSVGKRQWMRYSPDDLVFIPQHDEQNNVVGHKRTLVDYKAPSSIDASARVSFQYVCQLHMGRIVCESNGVPIDEMMLSQFDWANWELKDDQVPHVAELDGLIEDAGDHYWAFVQRGELPDYIRKPRLEGEDKLRESLGHQSLKMARLRSIVSAAEKHIEAFEGLIKPEVAKFRLGGSKVQLEGIAYTASPKFAGDEVAKHLPVEIINALPLQKRSSSAYDSDAMLKKLKSLDVDVKQFIKPGNLDPESLYDALVAHGADADALMTEQLSGRVDKKLSADVMAWFEREFSDLLPDAPGAPAAQESADLLADGPQAGTQTAGSVFGQPQEMVAEGQVMPRHVPRPVSA
jgi:hypothetical protein